ncbi:MAG: terminase large subunit [Pirellulaceae bacterium]
MDLRAMQQDPRAFRRGLMIDADDGVIRLSEVLDDWQRVDFESLDSGWRRVAGQDVPACFLRAWLERPRGHSKTADLAVMVTWALFASRRQLAGVAAAADKDQARLLRDAIARLCRVNPWLSTILQVDQFRITNTKTGSTLDIISCDAPSSYGLTPHFIVIDELTHWTKRDLFDSLFSAAAKRKNCMVVVIANAGFTDSWTAETREAVRTSPDWYFSRLDGPVASWISQELLEEQRRLLPATAFDRLWLNRWSSGAGDALAEADIAAAVRRMGPVPHPEQGWQYVAGLDLGVVKDSSALIVLGRHIHGQKPTGRLRLASCQSWTPRPGQRVAIEQIEQAILFAHRRFHLGAIAFDPWQTEYLQQRLRRSGIATIDCHFSPSNLMAMATATIEAFSERNIELYDDRELLADLRSLRVTEKSYGWRLDPVRDGSGHGDRAIALALALVASRKLIVQSASYAPQAFRTPRRVFAATGHFLPRFE